MRMLVLDEEWGQKEQLKVCFDYQYHLGNCWRLLVQTVEAVTYAVSADDLRNKSSLSLETVHTQPCLPNTYCCLAMQCVKAGGLTACLYQPAKFCGTELARVGFSSLVKGTRQKWRLARLHT